MSCSSTISSISLSAATPSRRRHRHYPHRRRIVIYLLLLNRILVPIVVLCIHVLLFYYIHPQDATFLVRYVQHHAFPFLDIGDIAEIPPYDPTQPFPRHVYQTWKTKDLPEALAKLHSTWTTQNLNYTLHLYDDDDISNIVRATFPEYLPKLTSFYNYGLKTDLFRYLMLYSNGGIYADIDTKCLRPISQWTDEFTGINIIVGLEADTSRFPQRGDWGWVNSLSFANWAIASTPGHPILRKLLAKIMNVGSPRFEWKAQVRMLTQRDIFEWTGPVAYTNAILEYLWEEYEVEWGQLSNMKNARQFGDVLVLPVMGFNSWMEEGSDIRFIPPEARVQHLYHGSWKLGMEY